MPNTLRTMSTSMGAVPLLEDASDMLIPIRSSPLTLPATLPATLFAALPPGVRIPRMVMGWVPLGALYAKGVSSSSSSSSLGVASRCVSSSRPASSGYRPLSMIGRGVRGSSDEECIRRWKAASDFTSSSSGFGSARILSIRGCFSCGRRAFNIINNEYKMNKGCLLESSADG